MSCLEVYTSWHWHNTVIPISRGLNYNIFVSYLLVSFWKSVYTIYKHITFFQLYSDKQRQWKIRKGERRREIVFTKYYFTLLWKQKFQHFHLHVGDSTKPWCNLNVWELQHQYWRFLCDFKSLSIESTDLYGIPSQRKEFCIQSFTTSGVHSHHLLSSNCNSKSTNSHGNLFQKHRHKKQCFTSYLDSPRISKVYIQNELSQHTIHFQIFTYIHVHPYKHTLINKCVFLWVFQK